MTDELILSALGIKIDDLKSLNRKKRPFYRNIIQCLRRCIFMNNQESIDNYLESIDYLCKTKDFEPIKNILNTPISLNIDFPEIKLPLSGYLMFQGLSVKLVAACETILNSFENENIDLLEIEFLYAKAKSGIVDRISGCKLFEEVHKKTEINSLLYIESLVCLAYAHLSLGNYQNSLFNFEKVLDLIDRNQFVFNYSIISPIKADVLEGEARLSMIDNNWQKSLSLYKEVENICKEYNFITKLVNCLGHQAIIYRKIKNYEQSISYFEKAKEIALNIKSDRTIEWINHHLAYVFLNQGKWDLSEELAQKCLEKAVLEKRDNEAGDFFEQMGLIKLAKNQSQEAIENLELSLFFRKKVGNQHGTASSYRHLSLAYFANHNYLKCYQGLKEHLIIFRKLKVLNTRRILLIIYLFFQLIFGKKQLAS